MHEVSSDVCSVRLDSEVALVGDVAIKRNIVSPRTDNPPQYKKNSQGARPGILGSVLTRNCEEYK